MAMMEDEYEWRVRNPELAAKRDQLMHTVREKYRRKYGERLTAEQRKERDEEYMREREKMSKPNG